MNHRRTIGHVVVILVGVEEKVRRIQHPQTSPAFHASRRDVQPIDERLVLVEDTVAIRVLVNGDLIKATRAARRRLGNLVIHRAPPLVLADDVQSGGRRILKILHHPHPPALIEVEEHRLTDDGFREDEFDFQIVGNGEGLRGFCGADRSFLRRDAMAGEWRNKRLVRRREHRRSQPGDEEAQHRSHGLDSATPAGGNACAVAHSTAFRSSRRNAGCSKSSALPSDV